MILAEAFSNSNMPSYTSYSKTSASFSDQLTPFEDLIIIDKLSKARFPVFLVYSPSMSQYFAMKVFPSEGGKISPYYLNEITFASLSHPNVISIVHNEAERQATFDTSVKNISYTVMEYAPYGDFFDVLMTKKITFDEKLARTYMHQLLDGIEYIHSKGMYHLDLKLENILLGEDFRLKIADFDHAHLKSEKSIKTKGTVCYRAPELIKGTCNNGDAADLYSAGIILFLFKTGGILPHCEHRTYEGTNLFALLYEDNELFWEMHCQIQKKPGEFFDDEFRKLFNAMVQYDPDQRTSISEIKKSRWFNGPVYCQEEIITIMQKYFLE